MSTDALPAVTFVWTCKHAADAQAREVSRGVIACETCGAELRLTPSKKAEPK